MTKLNMDADSLKRFWAKVDVKDKNACWLWTASLNSKGYGSFAIKGSGVSAHKISWALAHNDGTLSDSKSHVMHSCDVRSCVNPNHLSLGTPRDNAQDALSKGRLVIRVPSKEETCKRGHPRTPENTTKYNTCLICRRDADRALKQKIRAADPEAVNKYHREYQQRLKLKENND